MVEAAGDVLVVTSGAVMIVTGMDVLMVMRGILNETEYKKPVLFAKSPVLMIQPNTCSLS
jgi:hypothetical protein